MSREAQDAKGGRAQHLDQTCGKLSANRISTPPADSDDVGHVFQQEVGHRFRFEAGRGSDLMSATWRLLPRIGVMMFGLAGLVKLGWI